LAAADTASLAAAEEDEARFRAARNRSIEQFINTHPRGTPDAAALITLTSGYAALSLNDKTMSLIVWGSNTKARR
jgi:hypothetical protein